MKKVHVLSVLLLLLAMTPIFEISAQSDAVITVSAPFDFRRDAFAAFEEAHPGVKVVPIRTGWPSFPPVEGSIEEHIELAADELRADVIYTIPSQFPMTVEAVNAGLFLDLGPFVDTDPALDPGDFYAAIWESVRWDGGTWALPAAASVDMLIYDASALDAAGVPYPDGSWAWGDFADAAARLATPTTPGFAAYDPTAFFSMLMEKPFFDPSVLPAQPDFDHAELFALMDAWVDLQESGFIAKGYRDWWSVPLQLARPHHVSLRGADENDVDKWKWAMLPGETARLSVHAFAVNKSTAYPERSYELAKYLTRRSEATENTFADVPARRSLLNDFVSAGIVRLPDGVREMVERGAEVGQSVTDRRYGEYVNAALARMIETGESAESVLLAMEDKAAQNLAFAVQMRGKTAAVVPTPISTPVPAPGQVALSFHRMHYGYQEEWERFIETFVQNDPTISHIELYPKTSLSISPDQTDCYITPVFDFGFAPPFAIGMELTPFMQSDPDFDRDDFARAAFLRAPEGKIYGYPIALHPVVLTYDPAYFEEAGVPLPEVTWTANDFLDALHQLHDVLPDQTPLSAGLSDANYMLMLIAAFGAAPIDFRTDPPSVDFTSPEVMGAVRNVLDLAKQGIIGYIPFTKGHFAEYVKKGGDRSPSGIIRVKTMLMDGEAFDTVGGWAIYPHGTEFKPVSYVAGAAFVNSDAANPEACYRLIKEISRRPYLLKGGIPARLSSLEDPAFIASHSQEEADVYRTLITHTEANDSLAFPLMPPSYHTVYYAWTWLHWAFDEYVIGDVDLETALAEAERLVGEHQKCMADIPEDKEEWEWNAECARMVDPDLAQHRLQSVP